MLSDPNSANTRFDNQRISIVLVKAFSQSMASRKTLSNTLSFQFLFNYGLHPDIIKSKRTKAKVFAHIWRLYKEREALVI